MPSAAGVPSRRLTELTETRTSAMTVIRYGSADQNSEGMDVRPLAWRSNPKVVNAPNRYAPRISSSGRQND
jgi:hypothetical protein